MSRLARFVVMVIVLAAVAAPAAHAAVQELGPVANVSPLSAHAGWVVWSELQPDGRWHLVAWHAGLRVQPRVPSRGAPFDADVGSDKQGRPVATYSRCAADPVAPNQGVAPDQGKVVPGFVSPNGLPRQSSGRRCGLRVLDLASGGERGLHVRRPRGASDTTPSMWRGDVAFARTLRGATVANVLLWRHRGSRIVHLRRGTRACEGPRSCTGPVRRGEAQQLDLGASAVAFVWDVRARGVLGDGDAWELRVDDLRTGASRNYSRGYQSGACGARYPVSPTIAGRAVWFAEVRWACEEPHSSYVHGVSSGRRGVLQIGPPVMWQVAVDRSTVYSIRGPRPAPNSDDPPCTGTAGPCHLVAEPLPVVTPTRPPLAR